MTGSSSKIPFTLPSAQLWTFPNVKSTTTQPGVVSLGEIVVFETQFDVLHGPCPPSDSWLRVHVLIAPIGRLQFVNSDSLQETIVDASGMLGAYWQSHGLDASCMTEGTWWDQSHATTTTSSVVAPSTAVATLRYMYSVQEDIAHGCLMQMRIGASLVSPIFTWSSGGSILPSESVVTPIDANNIYTFPMELAVVSASTGEIAVFRALQNVDLTCIRLVGGDGLSLGAVIVRMLATFTSGSGDPHGNPHGNPHGDPPRRPPPRFIVDGRL
jgi:hypothetical protein